MLNSKRLQLIADTIDRDYSHIWDCCCDHGLLGLEMLARSSAQVHFVDCKSLLTDALTTRLEASRFSACRWQVHCEDVCQLALARDSGQLIIIAGVGGDTCFTMVNSLLARFPDHCLDFIICPVRQQEFFRAALASAGVGLLRDALVEERGRHYEVMYLRQGYLRSAGNIAQDFWQSDSPMHLRYVQKRISYLSQPSRAKQEYCASALLSYQSLLETFFTVS